MEKITLKKVVNHRNKSVIIVLMTGIFMAFYGGAGVISNRFGSQIAFLPGEESIPLIPWTVLIYIILYPLYIVWSLYSYKDEAGMNKTLYGFSLLTLISCTIFLIFPVTYPRHMYPLGLENDIITLIARAVRVVDKPSNCLPSLHVGICFLYAFGFFRENKTKFWIAILISIAISISTLTTKQHYIVDIITGFGLSAGIWFCMDHFVQISESK